MSSSDPEAPIKELTREEAIGAYKRASEWRLGYIRERRASRMAKAKAHDMKRQAKMQRVGNLKSKALLLGETEDNDDDFDGVEPSSSDSSDDADMEGVPGIPNSYSQSMAKVGDDSDSDGMEPYWSAERGFEYRRKKGRQKKYTAEEEAEAEQAYQNELRHRDMYFLYPILLVTALTTIFVTILVGHAFIIDGTLLRVLLLSCHVGGAALLGFMVLIQFTFLYEHYTQAPSFAVLSSGFNTSWFLLGIIFHFCPELGIFTIAGVATLNNKTGVTCGHDCAVTSTRWCEWHISPLYAWVER